MSGRLEAAIARLNPRTSLEAWDEALRRVARLGGPALIQTNRAFHKLLVDGVEAEVREMPQRNLAVELLKKLLNDEIGASKRTNVVRSRLFSEKLEQSLTRYHNRAIETAQVIEALIELAKEMREASEEGASSA